MLAGGRGPVDAEAGWSSRLVGAVDDSDIVAILRAGSKIEAIKAYRERTGLGLAEAKDAVEEIERRHGL